MSTRQRCPSRTRQRYLGFGFGGAGSAVHFQLQQRGIDAIGRTHRLQEALHCNGTKQELTVSERHRHDGARTVLLLDQELQGSGKAADLRHGQGTLLRV